MRTGDHLLLPLKLDKVRARTTAVHLSAVVLVALIPAGSILILIHILFGATIFDGGFSAYGVWNDEFYYWHQIATFSQHGFRGGYYSYEEVPSASFSHFGAHGPIYPMLFGSIAHVVGWHYYSAALFHLIFLTLAIGLYVYFTKLRGPQLIVTALVFVTFWPLMFFIATPMEEGLHYTFACVFAIIFYHVATKGGRLSTQVYIASLFFFFFACLLRPTWSFLFLPFFVYIGGKSARTVTLSIIKAGIAILVAFGLSTYITAPFPFGFVAQLRDTPGFDGRLRLVRQHAIANTKQFLSIEKPPFLTVLQRLQQVQVVIFLVACCCVALIAGLFFVLRHSKHREMIRWLPLELLEFPLLFHIVNLGAVAVTILVLYDVGSWRDYRTIAPHLLLTILLIITMPKRLWLVLPGALILSNLFFAPTYLQDFRAYRASTFSGDLQGVHAFQETVVPIVRYEQSKNPWCNTLLSSWPGGDALPLQILGVPAGIGVSLDYSGGMTTPLKSKYILASEQTYNALKPRTNLIFVAKTSYGNLYRNLDANCGP